MNNPSHTPQSVVHEHHNNHQNWWVIILAIALTVISGLIYAAIYPLVPNFRELLANFGADLPAITKFILNSYMYYGLFFLVGLIPCIALCLNRNFLTGNEKKLFVIIAINFVLAFVVFGFVLVGMYLPIFQMGSVV